MSQDSRKHESWLDPGYCRSYLERWELSTTEVHYGWLAPGESSLRLLPMVSHGHNILDVGCGNGANLIALARLGARCFGLDVSPHMISAARTNCSVELGEHHTVQLAEEAMQQLTVFPGVEFDIALSVYSFEFLGSLSEFRDVLSLIHARMRPGGTFIFCFSHPLQHSAHANLANATARASPDLQSPVIYSFRDTITCLSDAGFAIERIVEQATESPSTIEYSDARRYPYHFRMGMNPCTPEFDADSNSAPHTVIYKTIKPAPSEGYDQSRELRLEYGTITLWGRRRTIVDQTRLPCAGPPVDVLRLAPADSVVAFCKVIVFEIGEADISNESVEHIVLAASGSEISIASQSLLAIMHRRITSAGLYPVYARQTVMIPNINESREAVLLERVDPIFGHLDSKFPRQQVGILVFVNGVEPGKGTVGPEHYYPKVGDRIEVACVVTGWGNEWRRSLRSDRQGRLFS